MKSGKKLFIAKFKSLFMMYTAWKVSKYGPFHCYYKPPEPLQSSKGEYFTFHAVEIVYTLTYYSVNENVAVGKMYCFFLFF